MKKTTKSLASLFVVLAMVISMIPASLVTLASAATTIEVLSSTVGGDDTDVYFDVDEAGTYDVVGNLRQTGSWAWFEVKIDDHSIGAGNWLQGTTNQTVEHTFDSVTLSAGQHKASFRGNSGTCYYESLTLTKQGGGGETSDSDTSSESGTPETITSGTIIQDSWNQSFPVDLTNYSSATLVISDKTSGNSYLKAAVNNWANPLFQEADKGKTTVDLTSYCGQSFNLILGANGARTFTITGTPLAAADSYTVKMGTISNGTVTVDGNAVSSGDTTDVDSGDSITLVATPASGYEFAGWSTNGGSSYVSTDATWNYTPNTNATITPIFELAKTTITLNSADYKDAYNFYYNDTAGKCYAVPFDFTTGIGNVTVTIKSGSGWLNVFGPRRMTLEGGLTQEGNDKQGTLTSDVVTRHAFAEGVSTFTISSSSATGRYYVAMSDSKNVTVEITYPAGSVATLPVYTVTIGSASNGSATVNSAASVKVKPKTAVTLSATPDANYTFDHWNIVGATVNTTSTSNSYTPTESVTITPVFVANAPTQYTITGASNGNGTVSGTATVNAGTQVTLTATPATGYHFVKWDDENTDNPRTVTANADATYTATFAINSYTITTAASPVAGGTVTGGDSYNHGAEVTLTATPNTGYTFTKWQKNGVDIQGATNATYTFTATETATYTAVFTINSYTITVEADPVAGGTVSGGGSYTYGQTANLSATANTGYTFDGWYLNSSKVSGSASYSPTVTGTATYVAKFEEEVETTTVSLGSFANGTVTIDGNTVASEGSINVAEGAEIDIEAIPNVDYTFSHWIIEIDGDTDTAPENPLEAFKIDSDITFTPVFVPLVINDYEIVGPYKAGTVSQNGDTLTATVSNSRDYQFVGWYSDAACTQLVTTDASTSIVANATRYAKFDYIAYNLPIIDIVTSSNNESFDAAWADKSKSTKYSNSAITISNTTYTLPTDTVTIKGRGNSTWGLAKKPFQLSFSTAVNLFDKGTAANKKWVLLANYADRSLLRNQIALDFARNSLNGIPFTSSTTPVEVYINGEYQGVYLVVEQSEVANGRVNADPATSATSDITEIGFLAEWDDLAESGGTPQEDYYVKVNGINQLFTIKSGVYTDPDSLDTDGNPTDTTTSGAVNTNTTAIAIGNYLNAVSAAIMSGDETSIRNYVDMNSLVDMFILQELVKNCDVGGSSFYISKDQGENAKLVFNPPWDFDRGFGNDERGANATGLYVNGADDGVNDNQNEWFQTLYGESWFKDLVKARWCELRADSTVDPKTTMLDEIDDFVADNTDSVTRNFNKRNPSSDSQFWGDIGGTLGSTFSEQVSTLKTWITNRIAYLDGQWGYAENSGSDTHDYSLTINAVEYPGLSYDDLGATNTLIPFVVNDTTQDIVITIPVTDTGDNSWINLFGPRGADVSWSPENTSDDEAASFEHMVFADDNAVWKYFNKTTGVVTLTIKAGSPTGIYYLGVSAATLDSITANFDVVDAVTKLSTSHTVTLTASEGGTVSQSSATGTYDYNTSATITATPNSGYVFVGWYDGEDNLVSSSAVYTFNVKSDVEYTAEFTQGVSITYRDQFGKIFETRIVSSGSTQEPPANTERVGYKFLYWTLDGSMVGPVWRDSNNKITYADAEDATVTDDGHFDEAVTGDRTYVAYYAYYSDLYQIETHNGYIGSVGKTSGEYDYEYKLHLIANTTNTSDFVYWSYGEYTLDANDEKVYTHFAILSYEPEFYTYVMGNADYFAVTEDDIASDADGVVSALTAYYTGTSDYVTVDGTTTKIYASTFTRADVFNRNDDKSNKISFMGTIAYDEAEYTPVGFGSLITAAKPIYDSVGTDSDAYTLTYAEYEALSNLDVYTRQISGATRQIQLFKFDRDNAMESALAARQFITTVRGMKNRSVTIARTFFVVRENSTNYYYVVYGDTPAVGVMPAAGSESVTEVTTPLYAIDPENINVVKAVKNPDTKNAVSSGQSSTNVEGNIVNGGGGQYIGYGMGFKLTGLKASDQITIKVYVQGQGDPYAIIWDGNWDEKMYDTKQQDQSQSLVNEAWGSLGTPTTFTYSGSDFIEGETYYAGGKGNEYINFWKVEIVAPSTVTVTAVLS